MSTLRETLLAMANADTELRAELVAEGALSGGYHPRMRELHGQNAVRLEAIVRAHGWPPRYEVGEDGQSAAWLILQHSIEHPDLMRMGLRLLREPPACEEADAAQVAMLEDRVRVFEGRRQRFGTQHDWDEAGELSPLPIEDPERVDELRTAVGLHPLPEQTKKLRERAEAEGDRPPSDWSKRQQEMATWARRAGWRG